MKQLFLITGLLTMCLLSLTAKADSINIGSIVAIKFKSEMNVYSLQETTICPGSVYIEFGATGSNSYIPKNKVINFRVANMVMGASQRLILVPNQKSVIKRITIITTETIFEDYELSDVLNRCGDLSLVAGRTAVQ